MQFNPRAVASGHERREVSSNARRIRTFVVLDFESNDLPHSWSNMAITELSMYAFAARELELESIVNECPSTAAINLPELPRVLHKLTLLFNPRRIISSDSEEITGLNNYILEHESSFNANVGTLLTSFLQHLQQPVCLVAHNGDYFDFWLLKQSLNKLNVQLPKETLCVDSLRAFWGIDDQKKKLLAAATKFAETLPLATAQTPNQDAAVTLQSPADTVQPLDENAVVTADNVMLETEQASTSSSAENVMLETEQTSTSSSENVVLETEQTSTPSSSDNIESTLTDLAQSLSKGKPVDSMIDWQLRNESTPKRPTTPFAGIKRPTTDDRTPIRKRLLSDETFKSRRVLFPIKKVDRYPPRKKYKLQNLYKCMFQQSPSQAHHAESDVDALTKLMLAYGVDFLAYAENHAKPFATVQRP